jgi:hypothetical protein
MYNLNFFIMATYKQGVHGDFSGRVGNIVGSSWKGRSVMKIRPAKVNNPRTPAQQANRGRFSLMGRFLSTQSRLIRIGWNAVAQNTTAFNEAMRFNLAEAIGGEHPDQFIDFSKIKLSSGQLPVPANLQAAGASAQSLNLTWENNSGQELANGSDLLMVGLYNQDSEEGYTLTGNFTREQEAALIALPDNWKNRTVEVFVFMVSTLGIGSLNSAEYISPTVYAGNVVLTD